MAPRNQLSGDPRRPDAALKYVKPVIRPEDLPPDWASILALFFSISGLVMRYKLGSWIALFLVCSSLATRKHGDEDELKQQLTSGMFAVTGLLTAYLRG